MTTPEQELSAAGLPTRGHTEGRGPESRETDKMCKCGHKMFEHIEHVGICWYCFCVEFREDAQP